MTNDVPTPMTTRTTSRSPSRSGAPSCLTAGSPDSSTRTSRADRGEASRAVDVDLRRGHLRRMAHGNGLMVSVGWVPRATDPPAKRRTLPV